MQTTTNNTAATERAATVSLPAATPARGTAHGPALEQLSPAERAELDAWLAAVDKQTSDGDASGDDHRFDLWLSEEMARIWKAIRRLELAQEAAATF